MSELLALLYERIAIAASIARDLERHGASVNPEGIVAVAARDHGRETMELVRQALIAAGLYPRAA